jgi:2-hydroxy-6-oxo-6-(2'-carboxyphenyl)-hexa-2,4-dienoate hydrolase
MRDGLDGRRIRFVSAAGVRTRVYEAGAGETLVLIHGGLFGSLYSLDCFSLNFHGLAHRFRVVAFDRLGQGHTGSPGSDGDYTYPSLLVHTLDVLDALGGGPMHLVGHSMGALLAAQVALRRPLLTQSVVFVDSNTAAPDDPRFPREKFYRELEERIPPGPPTRQTVRMEPDEQSFSRAHVTADFVDRLLEIARLPAFRQAAARINELRDSVWNPSLQATRASTLAAIDTAGLPCPCLVVWGADDISAPLPVGISLFERVAAKTPRTELHVLARAGHYCFREQPEAFDGLVTSFCHG